MTLAPPSRARWTKARRTPDLPIPPIPCRQITCVSPRRSSSRARSSASRPTKGTRRRWGTAVAMTAVSPRAPLAARAGSDALDDRDRQLCAHLLLVASVLRDRGCRQLPEPGPRAHRCGFSLAASASSSPTTGCRRSPGPTVVAQGGAGHGGAACWRGSTTRATIRVPACRRAGVGALVSATRRGGTCRRAGTVSRRCRVLGRIPGRAEAGSQRATTRSRRRRRRGAPSR